jgi:NADH:ubiquinone oxidoreductase subunit 3 (subunit A)
MSNILMLFIFVPILALILLLINFLLAPKQAYEAKVSAYECGFSPIYGQTRNVFYINFFLVALLFLVFDLEILLLFPIAVTLYNVSVFGFSVVLIFFIVLTIGFILEIGSGSINLVSSNSENLSTNKNSLFNTPIKTNYFLFVKKQRFVKFNQIKFYSTLSLPASQPYKQKSDFLNWFSGFTDAEGHFSIVIHRNKDVGFRFVIVLHLDDIEVLKYIKQELSSLANKEVGIIQISKTKNLVSYTIQKFDIIKELIIPIFNIYILRTAKYLDFKDWEKAVLLKINSLKQLNSNLSDDTLTQILTLKKGMNRGRTMVNDDHLIDGFVNPYWLVGFCEGDSSFFFTESKLLPRFAIAQNNKSIKIMKIISHFFLNLSLNIPNNIQVLNEKLNLNNFKSLNKDYLYKNKNKIVFDISRIDLLFYQILPFFESCKFFSRKGLDFQIWSILLKLRYLGYHNVCSIKMIMLELAKNMNNARYLNKKEEFSELIAKINKIINTNPYSNKDLKLVDPLSITVNESIIENYPKREIYVYDNNILLKGSPFSSIRSVAQAINSMSSQIRIKNLLNTNKLFKNRYTFYSKPINNT